MLGMLGVFQFAYAQVKYEKEYRIQEVEVPQPALDFIKGIPFSKKIKWYKEEGLKKYSFEAKTKFNDRKYSVEFDSTGILEDIEIEIPFEKIPGVTRAEILQFFENEFQKVKLSKVQFQITGNLLLLQKKAAAPPMLSEPGLTICYELIVRGKRAGRRELLELLFNEEGALIKESRIILQNTDNLEY